ncbi:MAG: peptidoglycan-binding protein [Hormoscilla sp. GUM202]|nr:peptidoglycan-binding protein [Hormoscilla sp. GUM202]
MLSNEYPVLRRGDGIDYPELRESVKLLQKLLIELGFLKEGTTLFDRWIGRSETDEGQFGRKTEAAVKRFQESRSLIADGVVWSYTWDALFKAKEATPGKLRRHAVLRIRDGIDYPQLLPEVRTLQDLLKKEGFMEPSEPSDGLFGPDTLNAVKNFQNSRGLVADGMVGQETWSLLWNEPIEVYLPYNNLISSLNLDRIIASIPYRELHPYAWESIPLILRSCDINGVIDLGQIAYILATAEHESRLGQWMEELASGWAYEWRSDLGNNRSGDGPRYKGRGFVQITGRRNYTDWSGRLGIDLVNVPEKAAEPDLAAKILVIGMRDGTFTNHRLGQYIWGSRRDFYNARRIVNRLDRAAHIAAIAEEYYRVL